MQHNTRHRKRMVMVVVVVRGAGDVVVVGRMGV